MHHETERLRSLIGELLVERDRYHHALMTVFHGEVPRERAKVWRDDGTPSKHDRCEHDKWYYEDCESCIAAYVGSVLASVDTHPKGGDAQQAPSPMSGAVPRGDEADARTSPPKGNTL